MSRMRSPISIRTFGGNVFKTQIVTSYLLYNAMNVESNIATEGPQRRRIPTARERKKIWMLLIVNNDSH